MIFGKANLSDDHIRAIGTLVAISSRLEGLLIDLASVFLNTNIAKAVIVFGHQQPSAKVDTLLSLMKLDLGDSEQFQPIFDTVLEAKRYSEYRNSIVHAYWYVDGDGIAHTVRFQARGKFKRDRKPVSASKIQKRADEGLALVVKLEEMRDHFLGSARTRPPSPQGEPSGSAPEG